APALVAGATPNKKHGQTNKTERGNQ
ncbi:MAG: hypothetical protein JWQ17_3450, partial [Tardiphaga sp.]|nr:hypothetical protein [Tardiphaga sp.]